MYMEKNLTIMEKKFNRYPKHIEELEETLKKPIDEKIEQIKKEIAETQEKNRCYTKT